MAIANGTVPPTRGPRTITVPNKMGQPQRSGSPAAAAKSWKDFAFMPFLCRTQHLGNIMASLS